VVDDFERERERELFCVLLGSGGWIPTPARATSALLIRQSDRALLLDAGTGTAALLRDDSLLDGVERLDIAVSHFHLDHVAGLTYLPALAGTLDIRVWGPGKLLAPGSGSGRVLSTLIGAPFLSADLDDFAAVDELREGDNQLGAWTVACRIQANHPGGSVAFRLGDWLAYCTDTAPDPGSPPFVEGVDVLVHEAWTVEEPTRDHSSAASAAGVAAGAGVRALVLSHVHPLADRPAALQAAARKIFENTEVGHDGQLLARPG
jgi:ribonuclease BN (tRNA processing enzyme)